ncbi:3-oxoacid CoA-transferase subunit A [Spongiactinospora sp. TRM90649]|uniref:3-oxoacid CoA-transferase n=1 Tax=Spongiactinospora sp. TRM90649 TaxID=3031114 RepID=UPI0023F6E756|nr:3-oxoacid CoA-transferase subunit A [Spongiactinospora sp. TRM90649]MDF5754321.1 3-oxoacid CoA-transferase subunit A [Spongiactinospora sp. TRM90649]
MTINKIYDSPAAAVADVPDGSSVSIAGFGMTHSFPTSLTVALREQGARRLCIVANSLGTGDYRSNTLIENHQVNRLIVSFSARAGEAKSAAEQQIEAGEITVELVPQGTLVERLRAGGAGIGAFFTRTGVGTAIAEGKEVRTIDGVDHILEYGLKVDYALIRAARADRFGNLQFTGVGRNFMPAFAKGAKVTVAEVDEIVDGTLDPEAIGVPGVFVDRVVRRTVEVPHDFPAPRAGRGADSARTYHGKPALTRRQMAELAAGLVPDGSYMNLGLGIPTLISNYVEGRDIVLHSENGVLGYGMIATREDYDPEVYNAGGQYVHLRPGASFFESVTSFEMVRGGRVGFVALGGFQVDGQANLANWSTPDMIGGGIGGAMDLVAGDTTVMVLMTHCDSAGRPKLVKDCDFPLTGLACVNIVVTDLGVLRWDGTRFALEYIAPGFTAEEVAALTELELDTSQVQWQS